MEKSDLSRNQIELNQEIVSSSHQLEPQLATESAQDQNLESQLNESQKNLNTSKTTISIESLLNMSKLTKADLTPIAEKHKLLANTLVCTKKPLSSDNWETWKVEFEILMRNVRLDTIILKEWDEDAQKDTMFVHFNQLARDNILYNVGGAMSMFLKYEECARESYQKLIDHFEGSKIIRGWRLCKSLANMLTEKNEKLDEITFKYQSLVDQFNSLFPNVPEEFYVSLFCAIVPDQYDYLLSDILSKPDNATIKYADIVKLTMGAFARVREKGHTDLPKSISNVANIQAGDSKRPQSNGKQHNTEGRQPKKGARKPKQDYECAHCNTKGHSTERCWKFLQDIMSGKVSKDKYSQTTTSKSTEESQPAKQNDNKTRNIVCGALVTNFNDDDALDPDGTFLDCGAAACVFNTPIGATQMVRQQAIVRDWENRESVVQGVGTFKYQTETGFVITFEDALYKSTGGSSFISYSKLAKTKKFYMRGDDESIQFYLKSNNELVFTAYLVRNGLYKLDFKPFVAEVRVNAIQISQNIPSEILIRYWHKILEHADFGKIIEMSSLLNIKGKPKKRLVCDVCTETKATKIPFGESTSQAIEIFDLVHTDLSGIIRIGNPDGFSYFLLIVDDYSRYIFVYLISRKFQVAECFERFSKWVSTQFGRKIKNVRSDNGREFINDKMDRLISGEGSNHHRTAHGNPQQNARVERVMRSVDDAARALLKEANLHVKFWPYAILYAVTIKNFLPHKGIDDDIPYFRMFGEYPRYGSLHPFGLKVFALVLNPTTKFSDRAVEAIFLGCPQFVKGYYVYLLESDKIDVTRDIYLSEEAAGAAVKLGKASDEQIQMADYKAREEHQQHLAISLSQAENEASADHYLEEQTYGQDDVDFESCVSDFNESLASRSIADLNHTLAVTESDSVGEPQIVQQPNPNDSLNSQVNIEQQNSIIEPGDQPSDQQQSRSSGTNYRMFKDVYSRDANPNTYEQGNFVMNKSEYQWFTERFPEAQIRRISPFSGGPKNQRLNIWNVSAIQAPRSHKEASNGKDNSLWQSEMLKEYAAQVTNGTWELVDRPPNAEIYPMIWIFKYKHDSQGMLIGGKARLVILGNRQTIELDEYNFAPVANFVSVKCIYSIAAAYGLFMHHVDCDTAFVNAPVKGEIYAFQPDGFKIKGYEHCVLKLRKAQYGLRQSARRWYLYLKAILLKMEFKQLFTDSCLYIKRSEGLLLIIAVYVDDLLALSNNEPHLENFKKEFGKIVKIKDYGTASKFLGMEIKYDRIARRMEVGQEEYIASILKEAQFEKCNPLKVPMTESDFKELDLHKNDPERAVDIAWYQKFAGKLIYLVSLTRLDLAFVTSVICSRMHNPNEFYMKLLKNALRYLQYTKSKKLVYEGNPKPVEVYADSSFEDNVSRIGMLTFVNGNPISWLSRKQQRVATSTCESEILAVLDAVNEVEYFKCLLDELGFSELVDEAVTVFNDNMSAKNSLSTGGDYSNNKHYRNRVNRIVRAVDDKLVTVRYIGTNDMLADMMTKPLQRVKLADHLPKIGLI